jgi:uncharacterized protein YcaQ
MTSSAPAPPELTLSPDEARLITLRAQGFVGTDGRRGGVPAMLRRVGAVQLDTISVLARSHELVAYSRLGPVPRERIEQAYWHPGRPAAFEYWSHAACVLPIEEWRFYAVRRRAMLARGPRSHQHDPGVRAGVLARIRAEGPLTATDLGGARNGTDWWDWSDTKSAVEWLLATGEVICARRAGWRRVYDLPERVLPPELLNADPSDAECVTHLAAVTARALGVATRADLADYQRIRFGGTGEGRDGLALDLDEAAAAAGLVPVRIAAPGGRAPLPAWADRVALADPAAGLADPAAGLADPAAGLADPAPGRARAKPGRHRVTLLSPFDSLIWDRKRTLRMFGFQHSLEAYLPQAKRVHGYYVMPLLARGRLAGRVDPARSGRTLIARKLSLATASAAEAMARALVDAAGWVGCDNVELGPVDPLSAEPRLRKALSDLI